jgi:tetratricopeptide (TPR) repeat protein
MHIGRHKLLGAAAALAALIASPGLADVKSGVDAWQRGDFAVAVKEWRPAADQGDADAQFNLGQAYRLGRGVPADLRIAQSWFQKAAAKGHEQAQANLGLILYEGGKRREALPWIRKAADRGDPRAQYVLGIELTNGDLIAKDWPRAYALMTRAAAQGLPAAARSLGQMEQFVPADQRQKGIALARQIERGAPAARDIVTAPPAPRNTASAVATARAAAPVPTPAPAARVAANAGGGWRAQLGAYGSPAAAQAQWAALSRRIPALGGLRPSYEKAGALTRLRAGPLPSRAAVDKVCAGSKAAGQPCFPVAP